jgi:glutaminyl-tRNA synthetase
MGVLDPVKLIITNYPEDKEEWLKAENNQEDASAGYREVPFGRELYIEQEDFKEEGNRKFFRLALGKEVRLKNAYIIKAEHCVKDADGRIIEIHCSYDVESKSGSGTEASLRKVKGTLHWVSVKHAINAEVRLYDRLFLNEAPDADKEIDFKEYLNPASLKIVNAYVEPHLKNTKPLDQFQFQRIGYFCADTESTNDQLIFNRTVTLRDGWAKK